MTPAGVVGWQDGEKPSADDIVFALNRLADKSHAFRFKGAIVDRTQERLAHSDVGIAFLRRIFLGELDAIRAGKPTKQWKKLDEAAEPPISIPEAAAE